jgi:predicted lysophospholipase L1 biosynthesis ABC-type transport system permease subunit
VGVRKTLGASRSQLAIGFLGQTFVLTLGASILAAVSAQILLPNLNAFLDRQIVVHWFSPQILGCLGALCLLTTLLAGLYPAFILAGFRPVEALRGRFSMRRKSTSLNLRRSLVTFQFAIAQVFIATVIITALQMQYLRDKPLGFNRQNVLNIRLPEVNSTKVNAMKMEIGNLSGVKNLTQSMGAPVSKWSQAATVFHLREKFRQTKLQVAIKITDSHYLDTYGISLRAGRFITTNDEQQCLESIPEAAQQYVAVVNEAAVKALGFASNAEALGQEITIGFNDISLPIVGVVQDFHTTSLHQAVMPTVMLPHYAFKRDLGIALEPAAMNTNTLAAIEKIWKKLYPDQFFESAFLDEHVASLYREESRTFALFKLATLLALLLNALGLIGLTAFVVEQKTKEIGIRKVLGATVASITSLLAKDFIKLALLAIVLATPLAWYAMQQWLADFAYRIDMRWWMFGLAGTAAVLIAMLTIGFQSVRAALTNPVQSLRNE